MKPSGLRPTAGGSSRFARKRRLTLMLPSPRPPKMWGGLEVGVGLNDDADDFVDDLGAIAVDHVELRREIDAGGALGG